MNNPNNKAILSKPFVLGPDQGSTFRGPVGGPIVFKATSETTGGLLLALVDDVHPGDGPPLHLHPLENEYFYVIEGDFRFRVDNEVLAATTGSFIFVPRTTPHCFQNFGRGTGKLLVLFTPAGMENFYIHLSLAADTHDPNAIKAVADEAGMLIVGGTLVETHPMVDQEPSWS